MTTSSFDEYVIRAECGSALIDWPDESRIIGRSVDVRVVTNDFHHIPHHHRFIACLNTSRGVRDA